MGLREAKKALDRITICLSFHFLYQGVLRVLISIGETTEFKYFSEFILAGMFEHINMREVQHFSSFQLCHESVLATSNNLFNTLYFTNEKA